MHDVIVLGAGTAGCVLAERLTASGRLRVLLIEAGGPPASRFVSIPAGFGKLFRGALDWAFESEPQRGAAGRRIFVPRGKMLGGSANLNIQIHQWCHPADFDGWAAAGAAGWGWDDVAPVFRRQERWQGPGGERTRGRDGRWSCRRTSTRARSRTPSSRRRARPASGGSPSTTAARTRAPGCAR